MTDAVAISIVIPAFNAEKTIDAQLEALSRQSWSGGWEVIVADNGSTDDTAEHVAHWEARLPGFRVVDASARRGAGHARNVGARAARGDYLLFVDADDVVQPGWLASMAEAAGRHPLIAGTSRETAVRTFDAQAGLGRATRWSVVAPSTGFLDAAASNNLGVRRDVWEAVGGFRESLIASEDTAFCWDAQLAGHTIHRVPDAVVSYTMRAELRDVWKQQFKWGAAAAQLYSIYRADGAPRSSTRGALVRSIGLLLMAPLMLVSESHRRDWVGRAARRAGRLTGSIRYRALFL